MCPRSRLIFNIFFFSSGDKFTWQANEKLPIWNFLKRKSWIMVVWSSNYLIKKVPTRKYQNWNAKMFPVNFESNFVQSGAGQSNLNFPWLFINIQNFSKGGQSPWEFPWIILEWTHLWTSPKFSWKKVECTKYWWRRDILGFSTLGADIPCDVFK